MGMNVEVTCDGCGCDITTRSNMVDYRLVLCSESKPGNGAGVYTAMHIPEPIARAHYFCRMPCLDLWRDRERHEAKLWADWWEKWKAAKGEKLGERMYSYPEPSQEIRAACRAQFEADALAAYPMQRATARNPKATP